MEKVSLDALDLSRYIRPGDGIVFGQGTGEPLSITEKLVAQRAQFSGAGIFFGSGFSRTFQPEHADHLKFRGFGGIGTLRRLSAAGKLQPVPSHVSQIGPLILGGQIPCEVAIVQVSPANERGEHSFGLISDYVRAAIAKSRVVIAEVSSQVPWVPCDDPLQESEITVAVETDRAPQELPTAAFGDLERQIAAHLDAFIPDRATLQVGIGAVPEALIAMLASRRDMGLHSGMIGDSVVDLIESGAITNAYKPVDQGVSVTGALFGTKDKLYRFAHRNKLIRMVASSYSHRGPALAAQQRLVSMNSALEVDLTGQVNAEAIGTDHIGGVGGSVDFVRAAVASEGGVSIIALPATGKKGDSKIVSRLSGPVTTARSDTDLVATEYGVAQLRGRTVTERVKAMVAIAAPQHRERLAQEAFEQLGIRT